MLAAYPRVLSVQSDVYVLLKSDTPVFFREQYTVLFTPCEIFRNEKSATQGEVISGFEVFHTTNKPLSLAARRVDAFSVSISLNCPSEQEYILRVMEEQEGTAYVIASACVYALQPDLQNLYAYKGDFHTHSHCSDGADTPVSMAVAGRRKGFDFMALTDHGKFDPSRQLQALFHPMPDLAYQLYTGEEIHMPWHQAHILNIGGQYSINQLFLENEKLFLEQVKALADTCPVPPNVDEYEYLAALWAVEQIRRAGGMSVFCHPYWRRSSGYELCASLTDALLESRAFDALELISGYGKRETDSNMLQLARYAELPEKPAVVGVSDAHAASPDETPAGEYLFGAFYTIVLAKSSGFGDIASAIRSRHSVAVEHQQNEQRHIYGPHRIAKYCMFLAREFFPEHDRLALQEAAAMDRFIQNIPSAGLAIQFEQLYASAFSW